MREGKGRQGKGREGEARKGRQGNFNLELTKQTHGFTFFPPVNQIVDYLFDQTELHTME